MSGNLRVCPKRKKGRMDQRLPDQLTRRLVWQSVGWLWVSIVIWLSLTPSPPTPPTGLDWDKGQHLLAYAVLMWWFRQAFAAPLRWAVFLIVLGIGLECVQGLGPHRFFGYGDMVANACGVGCGALLAMTPLGRSLAWLERRFKLAADERHSRSA